MSDLAHDKMSAPVRILGADENAVMDVETGVDGKHRALVKASIDDGDVTISSNLRIIEDDTQYNLSSNYRTVYSSNVASIVSGYIAKFDNKNVYIKMTIDGNIVFEISCNFLSSMVNLNTDSHPSTYISYNTATNVFCFTPKVPMKANSSVVIEAKRRRGTREVLGQYIQVAYL